MIAGLLDEIACAYRKRCAAEKKREWEEADAHDTELGVAIQKLEGCVGGDDAADLVDWVFGTETTLGDGR